MAIPVLDSPVAELRASIDALAADVHQAEARPAADVLTRLAALEQRMQAVEAQLAALPPGLGRKP